MNPRNLSMCQQKIKEYGIVFSSTEGGLLKNLGMAIQNKNFRTAIWTGCYLQMTLMCIPPCEEIGLEIHSELDQFIRVEQGKALVRMGVYKNQLDFQRIILGKNPLKVSVIYAPPNHPRGTIHHTKEDAQKEEY